MVRIFAILIAVPLILILAAALLLPMLVDKQQVLELASKNVREQTGATLVVKGDVDFSILPSISVNLKDTEITLPGEHSIAATARSLAIGLELWPLFSGAAEVGEIILDGLHVVVKSAPQPPALDTSEFSDAQLDAYYSERQLEIEKRKKLQNSEAAIAVPLALNVQRLLLSDSVLETLSHETGDRSRVEVSKLEATDLNLDNRLIPIEMDIRFESNEGIAPIEIIANGGVQVDGNSQRLTLESMLVTVTGAGQETLNIQTEGVVDLTKRVADLQVKLSLAEIRGEGELRYASFESPQIVAKLDLNQFDPALIILAGPQATSKTPGEAGKADRGSSVLTGKTVDEDQALPFNAIRAIDARAALSIERAIFSGHVIEKVNVKVRAENGIVKLNRMTGKVHGGKLDMKATFDAKHKIAALSTRGGLSGMSIEEALKAANAKPVATGNVDLTWKLKSTGRTGNQLIETITGPINLATQEVELSDMGVEKMLCEAVAITNREKLAVELPESTRFETLSLAMNMDNGLLNMNHLRAELSNLKLSGSGSLNILSQQFEAIFGAVLSEGLAAVDPACRINKRLVAIEWPVNCAGKISEDPGEWCSVDSQKIIKQMATKEVERKIEKEAGKLLDKFLQKRN
ncbi:MAG: AsmA family protein [Halioglobus sp.]